MPKFERCWCDKCQKTTDHFLHGVENDMVNDMLYSRAHLTCRECKTSIEETMVYSLKYEYTTREEV